MMSDAQLLRRYAEESSEAAFTEIVRRHVNLVYAAALRYLGGDAHAAEEVTQAVFLDLSRKARGLATREVVASWLYTSTRFAAAKVHRARARRQQHEQAAGLMQAMENDPKSVEWETLRPLVDDAMHGLNERDRGAILLRFFEGRPFAEIAAAYGLSEDAARMRVERALDKLRVRLARRGLTSSAAALGTVLANATAASAPQTVVAHVVASALTVAPAAKAAAWLAFVTGTKFLTGALAVAAALVIGFAMQPPKVGHSPRPVTARQPVRNEERIERLMPLASMMSPSAADRAGAAGRAFLAAHPEADEYLAALRRRAFDQNVGQYLRAMDVTAVEYAALEQAVVRPEEWTFRLTELGHSYEPNGDYHEAWKTMVERLRSEMGENRFREFQTAFALSAVRGRVRSVVLRLYDTDAALTPEAVAWLTGALTRHARRVSVSGSIIPEAASLSVTRFDWDALRNELAAHLSPAQIAALEAVHESSEIGRRSQGAADLAVRERVMLEAIRPALSRQYRPFYRALNLTAGEIAQFESVRMDHEGRMSDIRLAERGLKTDPPHAELEERITVDGRRVRVQVDRSIATLRRDEQARYEAEQRALLGPAGFAELEAFEGSKDRRSFVSELIANLSLSPAPLTPVQADQMQELLREANYQAKVEAEKNDWNGILRRAAEFLSPAQHAELAWLVAKGRDGVAQSLLIRRVEQWRRETGGLAAR